MPLCNVMLPAWLLYDRTVPAEEKSVIGCIRSFANRETRTARPGQRRIHRETGISLKTVNRCIARLSARGAFSTITRGRGRATSRYTALVHGRLIFGQVFERTTNKDTKLGCL